MSIQKTGKKKTRPTRVVTAVFFVVAALILVLSAARLVGIDVFRALPLANRIVTLLDRLSYEDPEVPRIDAYHGDSILSPKTEPVHDDSVINILFLGTDYRVRDGDRGRADSNILCSLNLKTGEIRLVSFERGIGVIVPGHGSDLLTHAYSLEGPGISQAIISQMFAVEVAGYVQVDFDSFAAIIDELGGVDVELTKAEADALNGAIPTQVWAWVEVHEGWNHLYGHDTLQYCRLRSIDSDWNRQRRQRNVLEQVQKRCREMSLKELLEFAEEVLPMVHTNLSRSDLESILLHLPKLLKGETAQLQVPDQNGANGTIRCVPEYESRKIASFLYGVENELESPY